MYAGMFNNLRLYKESLCKFEGEISVSHSRLSDGNYAYIGERIVIKAEIPREISVAFAELLIISENGKNEVTRKKAKLLSRDILCDRFEIEINSKELGLGLFFYYLRLETVLGDLYGGRKREGKIYFSSDKSSGLNYFQLTVAEKRKNQACKQSGIIYHIFVDRFNRGKKTLVKEGSVYVDDWYSEIPEYPSYAGAYLKNDYFFGGNIYGILEKLDYIKSLGASAIYLTPIFESPSNHKYDTADYENVDSGFGGNEALEELINAAGERGIGIILDGVFNHTGADSKYFNKLSRYDTLGAYQSTSSPYFSWYKFYKHPIEYESWWGIDILPRIFYESSDAEEYFLGKDGIVEKWTRLGIKGFRLDVADELSDAFIERMKRLLLSLNSDAVLYGEVWEDASNKIAYGRRKKYYLGRELDGVMNYPLRTGLISYIRDKKTDALEYALCTVIPNMPRINRENAMNMLGSHDTERILTALGGPSAHGKSNSELLVERLTHKEYETSKRRLLSAYTVICALPGIPTVYYGDEAGVEGYSDPFNRRTFPWGKEDEEILAHYRKTAKIREETKTLQSGDFIVLHLDEELLIFERKKGRERIVAVYNNSKQNKKISFSESVTEVYGRIEDYNFELKGETAYLFRCRRECEIEFGCY